MLTPEDAYSPNLIATETTEFRGPNSNAFNAKAAKLEKSFSPTDVLLDHHAHATSNTTPLPTNARTAHQGNWPLMLVTIITTFKTKDAQTSI